MVDFKTLGWVLQMEADFRNLYQGHAKIDNPELREGWLMGYDLGIIDGGNAMKNVCMSLFKKILGTDVNLVEFPKQESPVLAKKSDLN